MRFVNNLKKAVRLYTISKTLKHTADHNEHSAEREQAEKELFDLIESMDDLRVVLQHNHVSRDELKSLFDILCAHAHRWIKDNYVPASSLAFSGPLKYVVKNADSLKVPGEKRDKICLRLILYFRDNELGEVKEYRKRTSKLGSKNRIKNQNAVES